MFNYNVNNVWFFKLHKYDTSELCFRVKCSLVQYCCQNKIRVSSAIDLKSGQLLFLLWHFGLAAAQVDSKAVWVERARTVGARGQIGHGALVRSLVHRIHVIGTWTWCRSMAVWWNHTYTQSMSCNTKMYRKICL